MPSPIVLVCLTSARGAFQHDLHCGQEAAISSIALIECRLLLSLVFWGAIMNPSSSQSYRSKSAKLWRYRYRCVLVAIEHCGSVIRPSVVAGDLLPLYPTIPYPWWHSFARLLPQCPIVDSIAVSLFVNVTVDMWFDITMERNVCTEKIINTNEWMRMYTSTK